MLKDVKRKATLSKKLILKPFEKEILKDIFFSKVVNTSHLSRKFFKEKERSTGTKRMNKLFSVRYIKKMIIFERGKMEMVYSITPKGLDAIESYLSKDLIRRECQSTNLVHDLVLTDIRDRFEKTTCVSEVKSENELQSFNLVSEQDVYESFQRLNSDIYLLFNWEGENYSVAVEYENTPKEASRWAKYLLNYHLEENVQAVLYICRDHVIAKSLMKIEKQLAKSFPPKIYFCTLLKFEDVSGCVDFENADGKKLTVNFHK